MNKTNIICAFEASSQYKTCLAWYCPICQETFYNWGKATTKPDEAASFQSTIEAAPPNRGRANASRTMASRHSRLDARPKLWTPHHCSQDWLAISSSSRTENVDMTKIRNWIVKAATSQDRGENGLWSILLFLCYLIARKNTLTRVKLFVLSFSAMIDRKRVGFVGTRSLFL